MLGWGFPRVEAASSEVHPVSEIFRGTPGMTKKRAFPGPILLMLASPSFYFNIK
jgi:hypothetical protein